MSYASYMAGKAVTLEKERDALRAELEQARRTAEFWKANHLAGNEEIERLRAELDAEKGQEPVGVLYVGSVYGEELEDWEFEANQTVCDRLNEAHANRPAALQVYARPVPASVPEKLCYDSRWEISIDYVDGWNAAIDMMRGKSPSWCCPDCCIAFPFGQPKACPHDDGRCNALLAAAPEAKP